MDPLIEIEQYARKLKLFIDGLARGALIAEEEEVMLLVEPKPKFLLENSRQFLNFIKDVNSDSVRLNFDIGHFYCVREDPVKKTDL